MQQIETPTRWSLKDLLAEPVEQSLTENFSKMEHYRDVEQRAIPI